MNAKKFIIKRSKQTNLFLYLQIIHKNTDCPTTVKSLCSLAIHNKIIHTRN